MVCEDRPLEREIVEHHDEEILEGRKEPAEASGEPGHTVEEFMPQSFP